MVLSHIGYLGMCHCEGCGTGHTLISELCYLRKGAKPTERKGGSCSGVGRTVEWYSHI